MLAAMYRSNFAMESEQWSPHVGGWHAISGIQPSVANGITGDARSADHPISGTPYHGEDQLYDAFGMPQTCSETRDFSISTPARQAILEQRDNASRITGSFGRAEGKITGSDEANFQPVERANAMHWRQTRLP